jgi:hypothetical protein
MRSLYSPRLWAVAAAVLLSSGSQRAFAGPVYTFDNMPQGVSPFSDTVDGITARFGTPAGQGGVMVAPGYFRAPFSGNALFNMGVTPNTSVPVTANFSHALHMVTLDFATLNLGSQPSAITLTAFSGGINGTVVGSVSATGVPQQLRHNPSNITNIEVMFAPQGTLTFSSSQTFDTIEISGGPGVGFAIDNVNVTFPEPGGLTLAAVTLLGLGVRAWRRRGAKA